MLNIRIRFALLCCWATLSLHAGNPQSVAQSVLDRLYTANGNYTFQKPKLQLSTENKQVAAFSPWKNTITLDLKTYEICRSFGRDSLSALAYIIGHELVHAFQNQKKGQRIQTSFLAYDHAYQADVRLEKVADVQGLFNAYLAGFGVLHTMPEVIDRVYEAYQLKGKTLAGYPNLEERKSTAREVVALAGNLVDVFESCGYLSAIGQNGLAGAGYEYLLQYYQGVEIYNNLGVAYTLSAREFWNPKTDRFIYPIEADWYTKLSRIAETRGQEQIDPTMEPLRRAFLDKAEHCFREAARLSPNYLPAHINLVCTLNMQAETTEALKYAEQHLLKPTKARKTRSTQEAELAELALAITYALQPSPLQKASARAIFERLSRSKNALPAQYGTQNLNVLDGRTNTEQLTETPFPATLRADLDQLQLGRMGNTERLPLDAGAEISFACLHNGATTTAVFSNSRGNLVSLLRRSNPAAATAAPDSGPKKEAAPRNVLAGRNGYFVKFPREHAILRADATGRVLEVVKYIEHGR